MIWRASPSVTRSPAYAALSVRAQGAQRRARGSGVEEEPLAPLGREERIMRARVRLRVREGGAALRQWADRAVEALKLSESSASSMTNVRERMVQAARERFLVDSVVDK